MSNYQINSNANGPAGQSIDYIDVDAGISPVTPTSNVITMTGQTVAAGSTPIQTNGIGVSDLAIQVQITQAIASTDATKVGLAAFNSADFVVDANGFVSFSSTGPALTITGTTGGPLSPTANNWNLFANVVAAGTTPISVDGAVSTETIHVQFTQAIASTDATKVGLAAFNSDDFNVDANGFVSTANTFNGNTTTVGAVTSNVITIPLGAVAGTFQFEARVAAFEAGTPSGSGYNVYGTFRTDGATATLIGNQDVFNEDAVLAAADAYFIASANNAILQVLGVTALTIVWVAETELTISL